MDIVKDACLVKSMNIVTEFLAIVSFAANLNISSCKLFLSNLVDLNWKWLIIITSL